MAEDNAAATEKLVAQARDFSAQSIDLYTILGLPTPLATDQEITKAWRRQNLQLHPDKTRDAFDPAAYELIGHAKAVLLCAPARSAYDLARRATLQRQEERERMTGERRRFADDLEAAEEKHREKKRAKEEEKRMALEKERERLREEGVVLERERKAREEVGRKSKLEEREEELVREIEARRKRREEKAQRKREKAESRGEPVLPHEAANKTAPYRFSTDPNLTHEEKVAGVLAKLRAKQRERDQKSNGMANMQEAAHV